MGLRYDSRIGLALYHLRNKLYYKYGLKIFSDTKKIPHRQLRLLQSKNGVIFVDKYRNKADLKKVIIPDGVKQIAPFAFGNCTELEEIVIPEGLASVGQEAFKGCVNLREIVLPDSVKSVGRKAFEGCTGLRKARLPSGMSEIPFGLFGGCSSLEELAIPENVERIRAEAFCGSGIARTELPEKLTVIEKKAFYRSGLTEVCLGDNVASIGEEAFAGCASLKSAQLPESLMNMGDSAFRGCKSLVSVNIPPQLYNIPPYAFKECISLERVVIPYTVFNIGIGAFDGCYGIEYMKLPRFIAIKNNAFGGINRLKTLGIGEYHITMSERKGRGYRYTDTFIRKSMQAVNRKCTSKELVERFTDMDDLCDMVCRLSKSGLKQAVNFLSAKTVEAIWASVRLNEPDMFEHISGMYSKRITPELYEQLLNYSIDKEYHEVYLALLAFRNKYMGFDNDNTGGNDSVIGNRFEL